MSSPSSDSSISSWDLSSLSDMNVDQDLIEEEEKQLSGDQDIDAMEQLNRDKFIKMFKDKSNYPNANSIAVSDKLSWSRSKDFRIYDHYLEEREFPNDKRKDSKSPKRKLKDEYLMAIFEQLADKPEMKIPQMIIFIKDNYNVELSRSTIRRSLIESDYRYIGPKIRPKNSIKEKIKRKKWWSHQAHQNWNSVFFSDETTVYLENPAGFKWIHKDDQNISEVKRRRGRN